MLRMSIAFSPWPAELCAYYRAQGYWLDRPMTDILARQVQLRPNAPAIICGERTLSYAGLDLPSDNLAAYLPACLRSARS